jgi:hypothetical protein
MEKYTVLLLVASDLAASFSDTYLAHCEASNVRAAIALAQHAAMDSYDAWADGIEPGAFIPLTVFKGHLEDLKP